MKQKKSQLIFNKLSGIETYHNLIKIYDKYTKAKERKKLEEVEILKNKINFMTDEGIIQITRLQKIYEPAVKEITLELEPFVYNINTSNSFITELKQIKEFFLKIKDEVSK